MAQEQLPFRFDLSPSTEPVAPTDIVEEIAQCWGLPIGEKVEVTLRRGNVPNLVGKLELVSVPTYPWDHHQPLTVRVTGVIFRHVDIASWVRV